MSSVDLQGRESRVAASPLPPADTAPPHLPLFSLSSFPTLLPEHFSEEALKPDTSPERSGALFKITSPAARELAEQRGEEKGIGRARRLKLTPIQKYSLPRPPLAPARAKPVRHLED